MVLRIANYLRMAIDYCLDCKSNNIIADSQIPICRAELNTQRAGKCNRQSSKFASQKAKKRDFQKELRKCLQKYSKPVSCAERKRLGKNCGFWGKEQNGDNKQKISPNLAKRTDFRCKKHKFWSE